MTRIQTCHGDPGASLGMAPWPSMVCSRHLSTKDRVVLGDLVNAIEKFAEKYIQPSGFAGSTLVFSWTIA